ncbi:MAG: crossover junction endodeoxyribonuclease RuvC [Clostridia bacterium]|nr:crossover junction endodeoxyribonuclease RuvC [Clostridia bacterium]
MVILGIDPGYAIVGWGLVQYGRGRFRPLRFGAITTPAGMEFGRRLDAIYNELTTLLVTHKPDALAVERLYFQNNQKTAIDVAQARGIVVLAAYQQGVPLYEYTPLQVKSAVTGFGRAEKPQVMEMTRRLLGLKEVPRPDDTADALAIAICHGQMGGTALKRQIVSGTLPVSRRNG